MRGTVHSLIVLNIGFEPALTPRQMHRIAAALTSRFAHRHQKDAFGGPLEGLDPTERGYAERYWRQMITDGQIDRFDSREERSACRLLLRDNGFDYLCVSRTHPKDYGAVEAGPRNLPEARLQGGPVQENENL